MINSVGLTDEAKQLATDFIPEAHRTLPLLRLFLPFMDPEGDYVRWSRFVPMDDPAAATVGWFELLERGGSAVEDLEPCHGILDPVTAQALQDAIGNRSMHCLRWAGNEDYPAGDSVRVHAETYWHMPLAADELRSGARIPEFAWDHLGELAWGARLYPDSLIIAAELTLFRSLHNDPRIDTASVFPGTVFPWSSGD